jgi:hypothetical protein
VESVNLTLTSDNGSYQLDNTSGQVRRISVVETSGAAAALFYVYDGSGTDGQILDTVALSASQSTRDYYRCHEYPFHNGLFIDVVSGTFLGAVTVQHKRDDEWFGEPVIIVGTLNVGVTG